MTPPLAKFTSPYGEHHLNLMKDLFTIQTESGQLWIDIKAQLDAKDAELAELAVSHAKAIAAKDAEAWDTINAVDEAIAAKDAQHAADLATAVEAEARAVHARLDALVQAGQEAHAAGDLDAIGKVLVAAYAHTSSARRAKLEADLAAAQAAVTAAADKLAAL